MHGAIQVRRWRCHQPTRRCTDVFNWDWLITDKLSTQTQPHSRAP